VPGTGFNSWDDRGVMDLFPRPRSVRWGGTVVPAVVTATEVADTRLSAEAYRLVVGGNGVELAYADENGRRYARQTLGQLTSAAGIASVEIHDSPDIAVRGHMLDISRDRVPTRATLELLVERLAICRYNHLQLYTEHTFAYVGHKQVWANASPMTADDMRWLDRLCGAHGIELAANQNTFGHMERWLRHDKYRAMAETPHGFDRSGAHRQPAALAPTQDNADFALELVRELTECLASRRVNIGCDEVFELGLGQSASAVAAAGLGEVFVEHVRRIADPLLADGYEVQFWADMVQAAPELARPLAEAGAVSTIWNYSAPDGEDSLGFGPTLEAFAGSGFRTWVAPGTSGWNSFAGRHRSARANILDAVEGAIEYGAEGILVTEWGDNGHIQSPFAAFPALAYGGATAWCRESNGGISDDDLARSISVHLTEDETGELARSWIELASISDTLGLSQLNGAQYFHIWVGGSRLLDLAYPEPDRLSEALSQVERAVAAVESATPLVADANDLVAETQLSGALISHGLRRLDVGVDASPGEASELNAEVTMLRAAHMVRWRARSREGGLTDSLSRLR